MENSGSKHQTKEGTPMTRYKTAAQWVLLLSGCLMIFYGAWRGEAATVFTKAIRLCMECVGIG